MKYGVFSVSMPEFGIEETAAALKELGYDGVEWRVAPIPVEKPKDVPYEARYWADNKSTLDLAKIDEEAVRAKKICDELGLEIFSLTTYLKPSQPEEVEKVLKAAKSIDCHQIRVFTDNYDGKADYAKLFDDTREQTKVLEKLARQYGVKIVYEIHMDNVLSSPSSARRLLDGVDPDCIGVIFDPGNMVKEGREDYQKSFEMLGAYLAHVHVKNGALVEDGRDELGAKKWKFAWTPLKEGMADLNKLFAVMHQMGYAGKVSVEDFSNDKPTREKLADNLVYLKQLFEAANQ